MVTVNECPLSYGMWSRSMTEVEPVFLTRFRREGGKL